MLGALMHACRLVAAGSNLTATLPLLSAYLLGAAANYSDARPCMAALLARLQRINATVIVLPASLAVSHPGGRAEPCCCVLASLAVTASCHHSCHSASGPD